MSITTADKAAGPSLPAGVVPLSSEDLEARRRAFFVVSSQVGHSAEPKAVEVVAEETGEKGRLSKYTIHEYRL